MLIGESDASNFSILKKMYLPFGIFFLLDVLPHETTQFKDWTVKATGRCLSGMSQCQALRELTPFQELL